MAKVSLQLLTDEMPDVDAYVFHCSIYSHVPFRPYATSEMCTIWKNR